MSISQIATQPICPPLSASTNHNYWLSCLSAIMPIDQPSRPSYQFRHHAISLSESYAIIHINHHVFISTIMLSICHHACQPSYLIPIIPSSIRFPRFINCQDAPISHKLNSVKTLYSVKTLWSVKTLSSVKIFQCVKTLHSVKNIQSVKIFWSV